MHNKNSLVGLMLETGLCEVSEKNGQIAGFLNTAFVERQMKIAGFPFFNGLAIRGVKQLGRTKEGLRPLALREMTDAEKKAMSEILTSCGLACIGMAAKLKG